MESSEDDAGTATNASRRESARERDVGLAEDVNATSSFQQKPSEARVSCQTPAMSEDNFDGDSVPSPSSQDVNTSTEAILDMIDEIVDGPDAPKRLQLTSNVVDALNEELATCSYNLNIVQESTISGHEVPSSLSQEPLVCTNASKEAAALAITDTMRECSTPSVVPIYHAVTDSIDIVPASSTASVSSDNLVSNKSRIDDANNCHLRSISLCSEEQTVQSLCKAQDRTIKCVSSSDNRDSVTVETAESTSSDNSVSESKDLHVEVQTRSPLRRRLVRPLPSDRRPDYTVSSTVDSLTENISITAQTSSEVITKDVTSSSDALSIHSNIKPEEIRNLSEINFCQAETSSPPKRVKLIRQKNTSGSSNRQVPENSTNILPEKFPCQSTSADKQSLTPEVADESLSIVNKSPSHSESSETLILDNNCESKKLLEQPVESDDKPSPAEHSQASIEPCHFLDTGDINNQKSIEQLNPHVSTPIPSIITSRTIKSARTTCNTEQPLIPARNSPQHINNIDQVNVCNLQETVALDYIPLCLPPKNHDSQSKNNELELEVQCQSVSNNTKLDLKTINLDKICEFDSSNNQFQEKSRELQLKGKDIEPHSIECLSNSDKIELKKHVFEPKGIDLECKNVQLESKISENKLESCELKSKSGILVLQDREYESGSDKLTSGSRKLESSSKLESNSYRSISLNVEDGLSIPGSLSMNDESISNMQTQNNDYLVQKNDSKPKNCEMECIKSDPDSSSSLVFSNSELVSKSSEAVSSNTEFQENCIPIEIINIEPVSRHSDGNANVSLSENYDSDNINEQKKVPPIKLNLSRSSQSECNLEPEHSSIIKIDLPQEGCDANKQVPKLTIKLKQHEEPKSPVRKVTIKSIRHLVEKDEQDRTENIQPKRSMTKLNIKPIIKPIEHSNDQSKTQSKTDDNKDIERVQPDKLPLVAKLNIKRIPKPPEKINDIHRKSSSSEISESEYSENDESTSTSDQASASDNGSTDVIPKVTIKLGKPGTESEGKFYTEKNVPKLTIKGIQHDEKVIISQSEDLKPEKIPKLTIKTVTKTESQPLSPKLNIKPLKPPDFPATEGEIPKLKISTESFSSMEVKESPHVPKLTIKAVPRTDFEARTSKKSSAVCDSPEHIPVVTKLNIKPILKPTESEVYSECFDDKVPVVSKLNIKPVIIPKENDLDSSIEDVPKVTKLNIKPLKNPEDNSSESKDCDELNSEINKNCIPVVTKINIKPIIKPQECEKEKDSENLSSETGNSSDDNGDHIPIITKLNIKPIIKPEESQESSKLVTSCEQSVPIVTKLNIKPLVKGESSPTSPKKEHSKIDGYCTNIPVVTKLNIKPILKPEETEVTKSKDDIEDKLIKNPPLVMKINMKSVTENLNHETSDNDYENKCASNEMINITKTNTKLLTEENSSENKEQKSSKCEPLGEHLEKRVSTHFVVEQSFKHNCVPTTNEKDNNSEEKSSLSKKSNLKSFGKSKSELTSQHSPKIANVARCDSIPIVSPFHNLSAKKEGKISMSNESRSQDNKNDNFRPVGKTESNVKPNIGQQKASVQNCTLLKKLLENTADNFDNKKDMGKVLNCTIPPDRSESTISMCKNIVNSEHLVELAKCSSDITISRCFEDNRETADSSEKLNDLNRSGSSKLLQILHETVHENVTKPLEITIADKISHQGSGQDSPRIILKINKTDHGPSAKIITEDIKRPETPPNYIDNTQDNQNDKHSPKKHVANSRRKQASDIASIPPLNLSTGKRLRSSRIVENTEKSQIKKNNGKRPPPPENSPPLNKEPELSTLQTKRLKLGQLLSGNNAMTITSTPSLQIASAKTLESKCLETKPVAKTANHSVLNSENCSKNGNSKLHNILSNLQAKQMQSLGLINNMCSEKTPSEPSNTESSSISCCDVVDVSHMENSHPELQQMIINENSDLRDLPGPEDTSQDPLEVENLKPETEVNATVIDIPKLVELTPQPRKRGRPRKLPVSEGAKPAVVTLPVPALEERPQRSLRLMRDRPTILNKSRGRGRGRGARRVEEVRPPASPETVTIIKQGDITPTGEIDPTSSRIKLPRMTEALDKMPSVCITPLSSRRRLSSENFATCETPELKVMLDISPRDDFPNTPEPYGLVRVRGRGSRGGRGRTPRARGRGRGGGRGAMYMKETMGIYGRVCGPATTTVQLFEEETCMMDDNATPTNSRPSHLLDDDSQSSVKSSTNESSKMKKSKFADLFDSNKIWTAADVKEYTWPPPEKPEEEHTVMMIQEQVAMFLGVKSFKRRYPEMKRRTITGEERQYVLSKGLVTEALCDLGITAVDASDVLDIMLSDYPHKYEEFRSHQRERQLTEVPEEISEEPKTDEKVKVEVRVEKIVEQKPELPKVDPEKTRQDLAAAAAASACEWNARLNARRGAACADLQACTVLRPRAPPAAPPRPHLRPPAGFYPHALLPGQYQHSYRLYTPDQLRYFPLNTVLAAPPAPVSATESSSDSEPDWGSRCSSSDDSDVGPTHHSAKRKKFSKVKRVSNVEATSSNVKEEPREETVDTCRVCKLRLEANRKYTHERFLVCANCNAKLHPACVELSVDTIRKCREYPWQCAECKTCCSCRQPADDDKMLFCDLCDRGFHIYCVGLDSVPGGRWHCVECAICKSCGARSPSGLEAGGVGSGGSAGPPAPPPCPPGAAPATWHHQTKRGPGGHKVYSHSLCTPCARAYRIGRYCPLCERSFIGPKGTMQLVICKLCDRQLHQECVKQSGAALRVMDYTCADCRRGGITSRAAAVRLAPRTIATLFMAKRRFNKYAHKQYMESRLRAGAPEPPDISTDLSADGPDLSADGPDLSVDGPDLSTDGPDLRADAPE